MAICLHKLVGRASVIKPILNQSRQLRPASSYCRHQRNAQVKTALQLEFGGLKWIDCTFITSN